MHKNRLEKIKVIHTKANDACASNDQDTILYSLNTLFYDEHTDWLIEQAEKVERYEKALKEIAEEPYENSDWSKIAFRYEMIAEDALKG